MVVCVYGNRAYEDTLIELHDIAEKSGFQVIAGIAAVAEHSIMHQYATGRPDEEDRNELQSFAEKILAKLNGKPSDMSAPQVPWGIGLIKKRAAQAWFQRRTVSVMRVAFVPKSVRRRQSAVKTPGRQTVKNVFPACDAFQYVRSQPVR